MKGAAVMLAVLMLFAVMVARPGDSPSIYDSLRTIAENAAKQMPKCK